MITTVKTNVEVAKGGGGSGDDEGGEDDEGEEGSSGERFFFACRKLNGCTSMEFKSQCKTKAFSRVFSHTIALHRKVFPIQFNVSHVIATSVVILPYFRRNNR